MYYGWTTSRLTLRDGTPQGDRPEKEARKTQNNMDGNCGVGKVNARMEIVGTSSGRRTGLKNDGNVASRPYVADRHEEGR